MSSCPSPAGAAGASSKPDRTIVLVGLMGSGKTSIGRRLAARLGLPFRDVDQEVEAAAGRTVEEIFRQHGEAAFREGERKVIARLLREEPVHVLATGGGSYMDPETRRLIRNSALVIWLRADLELLLRRTARRTHRPLLKQGNPRDTLERLIAERYGTYADADLVVDSVDVPIEAMVDRVMTALRGHDTVRAEPAAR